MNIPHITTIILAYNSTATIEACLESVFASRGKFEHDVIVMDNASQDNTVALLRALKKRHKFKLIISNKNGGFAAGINIGLRALKKSLLARDDAYVFLLNPDTVIKQGTIAKLIRFLREHPGAGIVEPQMRYPDGSMQSSNFGRFPSRFTELFHALKLHKLPPWFPWGRYIVPRGLGKIYFRKPRQWDWVGGGAMFMHTSVISVIGHYDERYFLYIEDIDFCRRARRAGFDIWYNPKVWISHVLGASHGPAKRRSLAEKLRYPLRSSNPYERQSLQKYFKKWGRTWF